MLQTALWILELDRLFLSSFAARVRGCGAEENVLLTQILGQIKEISLAALTLHASAILEKTSRFRHASANNTLIHRFIISKLPLPPFHHLLNSLVLLEFQFSRLVVY